MPEEERHDDLLASSSISAVMKSTVDPPSESVDSVAIEATIDVANYDTCSDIVVSDDLVASLQAGEDDQPKSRQMDIKDEVVETIKDGDNDQSTGDGKSTPTLIEESTEATTNAKQNGHEGVAKTEEMDQNQDEANDWLDIIGSGDLMKKIIRKGNGIDTRPVRGDVVRLNMEGQLQDGRRVEFGRGIEITLGDAETIQGLDLAIPLMELGEIAEIVVKPRLAYGKLGREPDIPPNATINYKVDLLGVEDEPDPKTLAYLPRTQIGNRKREQGNFWFSRGEYSCALQCYRKALDFLDEESEITSDMTQELRLLLENRVKVYNNMAAAQLKIGALDAALKSVENVLKVQPANVKALFRKGKILESMGQTVEAMTTLKEALQLEPEAKIIHHELSKLAEKQKAEEKTERELYRRMLGQDKQLHDDNAKKSKSRPPFGFIKWGFVAGGLTIGMIGVVLYRHFHGI